MLMYVHSALSQVRLTEPEPFDHSYDNDMDRSVWDGPFFTFNRTIPKTWKVFAISSKKVIIKSVQSTITEEQI